MIINVLPPFYGSMSPGQSLERWARNHFTRIIYSQNVFL